MSPLHAVTSTATTAHPTDPGRASAVKTSLTRNRRRRVVENDEYAAFLTRVVRAYARRVAAGDVEAITLMCGLAAELDSAIAQAITGLREIGSRLGVTRQATQQRWGRPA